MKHLLMVTGYEAWENVTDVNFCPLGNSVRVTFIDEDGDPVDIITTETIVVQAQEMAHG